jgi:SAM-dependent methyltransferase
LWDYYKKGEGTEVIERDDGYIDPSETAPRVYFAPFDEWPAVEKEGIGYARGRVLDVGCGAGRVGIYLQRHKKLDVTGIDISPLAIKVSRLRGLRKARLLAFEDIDFEKESFDSVVMFGNNFGLFGSTREAKRLLRRLFAMTSADAVIICDSIDPYRTSNPDHLNYQERNRRKGRMSGQVRIRARYRSFIGRWFDYLLVSPREMRKIVGDTGWEVNRIIRSEEGPLYVGVLRKRRAMIPQASP